MKKPGSVQGQPFVIDNCNDCTLLVLDHCAQAQIDNVSNSKIFIGASSDSVFVRNCSDCTFTVACGQLRTRDCQNCTFNLYCKTEPVIETSLNMKFGPFNGVYPGHRGDLLDAELGGEDASDVNDEKWQNVFDFNDPSKTGEKNWRLLQPDEQQGLWCPLGKAELCIISSSSDVVAAVQQKVDAEKDNVVDDDYSFEESKTCTTFAKDEDQKKEGTTFHYKIKAFVSGGWSIMWTAVISVQEFCLNLFFKAFQPINKMLASGE